MMNHQKFLKALEFSFKAYKEHGARSTAKLKKLHRYFADVLLQIWGDGFQVYYLGDKALGDKTKEKKIEGKYYDKNVDVTVAKDGVPVFCLGIKFVTSNYQQNANNYFENMMGETANIQASELPYAQLIILRQPTPYYKKNTKVPAKWERITDHAIKKYSALIFENRQAHRPLAMATPIVHVDENTMLVGFADLKGDFSEHNVSILNGKLSLENLFKEITEYKNYFLSKNNGKFD